MSKHHNESKLAKRADGIGLVFTRWISPHERLPDGKIDVGTTVALRSAVDESVGIFAEVLSYDGRRLTVEILGFEMCSEARHNGMTYGDTISCDDSYVISCQCE